MAFAYLLELKLMAELLHFAAKGLNYSNFIVINIGYHLVFKMSLYKVNESLMINKKEN